MTDTDGAADAGGKHIVETLIEERAARLVASPLWPLWRRLLYPLLRQPDAVKLADEIAPLSGPAVMDHVSALLDLRVDARGLDNIPRDGAVIIAPTHPTGIADGVALYDALKGVRDDAIFFANRDALRVAPRLDEVIIPVEWVAARRTRERSRETLTSATAAFEAGRCVVLFPSGRIAWRDRRGALNEQPWLATLAVFARKYRCPIVPAHVTARNSRLYYWFWKLNAELRDITLFNELLNKRGKLFRIRFGEAVPPDALPRDSAAAAAALQRHAVEDLPAGRPWCGSGPF